jgi:hypothetical protein
MSEFRWSINQKTNTKKGVHKHKDLVEKSEMFNYLLFYFD